MATIEEQQKKKKPAYSPTAAMSPVDGPQSIGDLRSPAKPAAGPAAAVPSLAQKQPLADGIIDPRIQSGIAAAGNQQPGFFSGAAKTAVGAVALPFSAGIDATRRGVANLANINLSEPYRYTEAASSLIKTGGQQVASAGQRAALAVLDGTPKTSQQLEAEAKANANATAAAPAAAPSGTSPRPAGAGAAPGMTTIDRGDGTFEVKGGPFKTRTFTDDPARAAAEATGAAPRGPTVVNLREGNAQMARANQINREIADIRDGVRPGGGGVTVIGRQPTAEEQSRARAISQLETLLGRAVSAGQAGAASKIANELASLTAPGQDKNLVAAQAGREQAAQALDIARMGNEQIEGQKRRGLLNAQEALLLNPNDPQALATYQALTGSLPAPKEPRNNLRIEKLAGAADPLTGAKGADSIAVIDEKGNVRFVRDQQSKALPEGFTPESVRANAEKQVKAGTLTKEAANKQLQEFGLDPL